MVNVNKLKGKIIERGFNIEAFAKMVGINKSTFYRKLNANGATFSIKEASLLVELLGITKEEAASIFFADIVA